MKSTQTELKMQPPVISRAEAEKGLRHYKEDKSNNGMCAPVESHFTEWERYGRWRSQRQ